MTDSIVNHYHHSKPRDCSKGHVWRIRFKSKGDVLGWVKICRRCDKVMSKAGSFDAEGNWIENDRVSEGEARAKPLSGDEG